MLRDLLCFACFVLLSLYSCTGERAGETASATTPADSLYHLAIGYHDEAMPRMNELMRYEDQLDHIIDSLTELESSRSIPDSGLTLATWLRLKQKISNAMLTMNNWMDNFEPEPLMQNEDSLNQYFQSQATAAKAMRDSIFFTLDTLHVYLPASPKK